MRDASAHSVARFGGKVMGNATISLRVCVVESEGRVGVAWSGRVRV
jgi:hypothetical protein